MQNNNAAAFKKLANILDTESDVPDFGPTWSTYKNPQSVSNIEEALARLVGISSERDSYYKDLDMIKDHYLVRLIIDVLSEDIFIDTPEGYKIEVSVPNNAQYDKELKEFFNTFSLPNMVGNLCPELLFYGEYALWVKNEGKGKGITDIVDKFEPGQILGIYNSETPVAYYARDDKRNYTLLKNNSVFHIISDFRRIPLKLSSHLHTSLNSPDLRNFPRVRVGRSCIHSSLAKLKELMTKEFISMMKDISATTRPTIVGITLPENTSPKDIIEITRKYEKLLNENGMAALDSKDPLKAVTAMMEKGTRIRVLPEFTQKGSLSKMEINDQLASDQNQKEDIKDLRETILTTNGIPVEIVFGESESKRATLKKYVRYAKKIKTFQRSIAKALKYLCINHLSSKYSDKDIDESEIVISIYNPTNLEELDDLEGTELAIQNATSVLGLIGTLATQIEALSQNDAMSEFIDKEEIKKFIHKLLKNTGSMAHNIFIAPEEEESKEESQGSQESI